MKRAPAIVGGLLTIIILVSIPLVVPLRPVDAQGGIEGDWETIANGDDVRGIAVTFTDVWAGTHNGGAVSWSLDDGSFKQYLAPQTGLAGNDIRAIDTDKYSVWFATDNGVSKYDPTSDTWTTYTTADGRTLENATAVTYRAQDGTLWIGTSQIWNGSAWEGGGLSKRNANGEWDTYSADDDLPSNNVTDIAFAANGDVWIATRPYKVYDADQDIWADEGGGVVRLSDGEWTPFNRDDSELPNNHVNAVATGADGRVWFATPGGLAVYNPQDESWYTYKTGDGLESNKIRDVTVDASNRVWATTYESETTPVGALNRLDGDTWTYFDDEDGLSSRILWAVRADNDGRIWVGSGPWCRNTSGCEGGGLNRFQPLDNTVTQVYRMADAYLASNRITDVAVADDGTLWVTTLGSGVSMRDTSGQWHHFTMEDGLTSDLATTVAIADNAVWIGTLDYVEDGAWVGGGINVYQDGGWTSLDEDNSGLPFNRVLSIEVHPDGVVWIGTGDFRDSSGAGLALYDPDTDQWTLYTVDDGLPSNLVTDIAFDDENDRDWVATGPYLSGGPRGGGLARFQNNTWDTFTTANSDIPTWSGGDVTGDIRAVVVDDSGNPWVGTYNTTGNLSIVWPYVDAVAALFADGQWTESSFDEQGFVSSLELGSDGTLWAGISLDTLWAALGPEDLQVQPARGGIRARIDGIWYAATAASSGLAGSDVTSLFLRPTGDLWIGTANAGLSILRNAEEATPTSTTEATDTPSPTATEGPSPTPSITNTPAPPPTVTRTPIPVTPTPADVVRPAEVPEAATLILVGTGLAGLGGYAALRWRSRNSKDK